MAVKRKKKTTKKKPARKTKTTTKAAAKPRTTAKPKKTAARNIGAGLKAVVKPRTKSQIMSVIADETGLAKKDVTGIFECLGKLIHKDIGKQGPGQFTVPGLMKIVRHQKPATKARKGTNPFTGEEMVFKAKPARNVVKVRPLKGLKEMV